MAESLYLTQVTRYDESGEKIEVCIDLMPELIEKFKNGSSSEWLEHLRRERRIDSTQKALLEYVPKFLEHTTIPSDGKTGQDPEVERHL